MKSSDPFGHDWLSDCFSLQLNTGEIEIKILQDGTIMFIPAFAICALNLVKITLDFLSKYTGKDRFLSFHKHHRFPEML